MKIFSGTACLGLIAMLAACGGSGDGTEPGTRIYNDWPDEDILDSYSGTLLTGTLTEFEIANSGLDANTALPPGDISYSGGLAFVEFDTDPKIVRAYNGNLTLSSNGLSGTTNLFVGSWDNVKAEDGNGTALSVNADRVVISGDWGTENPFDPSIVINGNISGVLEVEGDSLGIAAALSGTFAGDDSGTVLGLIGGFTDDYDITGAVVAERN